MKATTRRAAVCAAIAMVTLAGIASAVQAQEGPRLGEYKLVQVALTTGSVTGLIVLRGDGTYELYDMPRTLRSRGNYRYDPAQKRVVWLSGVNYEMGRGGTFSVEQGGRVHRIAMGPRTYAINGD